MRLNEKLIRANCPACAAGITLEAGSLDKKITCPKCRQSVVISSSPQPAAPKAVKKPVVKRTRNGHPGLHGDPPPEAAEQRIPLERGAETNEPEDFGPPAQEKRAVVYCICNGMLRKCDTASACCCYQSDGCVYTDTPIY